ncbi:6034_t:CDS:2 [Paraglomus brasilianum]|uniref:GDP-mannose transporter n=1 Tax=Paraglomus brasilianum TaxID=144538 RepID=A0A9N9BJP4_9GLOM|nr:6034_t:CDS:2 [Paraglomus brasilianum]
MTLAEMDRNPVEEVKLFVNGEMDKKVPQQSQPTPSEQSYIKSMLPVACYCSASVLMTITNKYVLSGYDFNMNFFLLTVQAAVCVLFLNVFKTFKLITYRNVDYDIARKWITVVILLISMIYSATKSLQFLSIPVYTIFKNLTIILIAYGELLWCGGSVTRLMLVSFVLMVVSSIIAAWPDIGNTMESVELSVGVIGYGWMLFNCLCSAAFVLTMRKRITITKFKDFDTVYYNNLMSVPLLMTMSLIVEDWSVENLERNFPKEVRTTIISAIVFSGASAFAISFTTAWCLRTTSSTTYSMVGALNKLPIAASGMVFFGDKVTFANASAILVGFTAGIIYSYAKAQQQYKDIDENCAGFLYVICIPLTQKMV